MKEFVAACVQANREIASLLIEHFDLSMLQKQEQGAGGDISSEADLLAERIFVKYLHSFGTIESEESGLIGEGQSHIIVDPLDGSANFASRFPYFGTSVAMVDPEGILDSAVVCNLNNGDLFVKETTEPVRLDNLYHSQSRRLIPPAVSEIGLFEKAYAHPAVVSGLLEAGYKFRAPGAVALSLAYAYSARFFLMMGASRIYDVAAGLALCEGLAVIVEEDYVIVSQSKTVAEDIERIVHRSML